MELPEILREPSADGDPSPALALAGRAEAAGDLRLAATALDRAYGCAPTDPAIGERRRQVLDRLAVEEHGLVFRYVPAGLFIRGSDDGDPDEQPAAPVVVEEDFWISETTISWAAFCRLMGWPAPLECLGGSERERFFIDLWGGELAAFTLQRARELRMRYCTTLRRDGLMEHGLDVAEAAERYGDKPMVAVS